MILNFREIAREKVNRDKKKIKSGMIYRSSYIAENKDNIKILENKEIDIIFDLRSSVEIKKAPSVKGIPTKVYSIGGKFETMNVGKHNKVELNYIAKYMSDFYTTNLVESKELKELIHYIIDNPCIFLYHCTAGKDRTGILSILLMEIMNFSKEDIYEEYLLMDDRLVEHLKTVIPREYLDEENDINDLLTVKKEYIDAYYNKIENTYKTYKKYMTDYLDIREKDIKKLQDYYLES